MGAKSAIEWTDATWNPVTGCTKITRGCDHCYAERFAERWRGVSGHSYEQGFDLRQWPSRLDQPARWRKPRMIFVNSMSDLFHKKVERSFVDSNGTLTARRAAEARLVREAATRREEVAARRAAEARLVQEAAARRAAEARVAELEARLRALEGTPAPPDAP